MAGRRALGVTAGYDSAHLARLDLRFDRGVRKRRKARLEVEAGRFVDRCPPRREGKGRFLHGLTKNGSFPSMAP
jgi:hypothetical protein